MSKKFKYEVDGVKNGFIPGVGEVVDGKIESDYELEGSPFKRVNETPVETPQPQQPVQAAPVAPPQQPNQSNGALNNV